jgi:hypothetical protein
MTADIATFETASGSRATRTTENVDSIEPELVTFVRGTARWLDPTFPQHGTRGPKQRGAWTGDDGIETQMQQVEELDGDGRGLRIVRLYRVTTPGGPFEGAIRIVAAGFRLGVELELRWNFVASDTYVRGTSAELTVAGPHMQECVTDFRRWFAANA